MHALQWVDFALQALTVAFIVALALRMSGR